MDHAADLHHEAPRGQDTIGLTAVEGQAVQVRSSFQCAAVPRLNFMSKFAVVSCF